MQSFCHRDTKEGIQSGKGQAFVKREKKKTQEVVMHKKKKKKRRI